MTSHEVLIVEDERLIALDLQELCEELGHRVLALAATATEARELLERLSPSLILSDFELRGDGDGVDVVAGLRRRCPWLRIVFVTAATGRAARERIASVEPDEILAKPVSRDALRAALSVTPSRSSRKASSA
jgi:CheY-like chemotaxis protein